MSERPRFSLMIQPAARIGFVIMMDSHVIAALSTRAEVAQWIEDELGILIPEEIERERSEIDAAKQEFPRVVGQRKATWFRGQ